MSGKRRINTKGSHLRWCLAGRGSRRVVRLVGNHPTPSISHKKPSVLDRLRGGRNRLSALVRVIQSNWNEAKSCLEAREARQR
jgi:hypothetical protein